MVPFVPLYYYLECFFLPFRFVERKKEKQTSNIEIFYLLIGQICLKNSKCWLKIRKNARILFCIRDLIEFGQFISSKKKKHFAQLLLQLMKS